MSKLLNKENLKPIVVLSSICIVVALLLAGVNTITGPIIEAAQNAAANEALLVVLPGGKDFTPMEITSDYPEIVTAGYKADGGFVFKMEVTGKSTGFIIMCGIDENGNVVGTKVVSNQETPSYAEPIFAVLEGVDGKYSGMNLDGFDPYLVAGSTTSGVLIFSLAQSAKKASV